MGSDFEGDIEVERALGDLRDSVAHREPPGDLVQRVQDAWNRGLRQRPRHHWGATVVGTIIAAGHFSAVAALLSRVSGGWAPLDYWLHYQAWQLKVGVCFCVAAFLLSWWLAARDYLVASRGCFVAGIVGLGGVIFTGVALPEIQMSQSRAAVAVLRSASRWVTYEPPEWDPHRPDSMPPMERMEQELALLREHGFDGVLTFAAHGEFRRIPEIAKRLGFRSVIVGIYIDRDKRDDDGRIMKPEEEIRELLEPAINSKVDGYCLGHNPPLDLDLPTLAQWMADLRWRTRKPVTVTFPLLNYLGPRGQSLRAMGDWFMPDVGLKWSSRYLSPEDAAEELRDRLKEATELPQDRPILLKMIAYPSGPTEAGFTPEKQAEFCGLLARRILPQLSADTHLCLFSGFDLPWKGMRPDEMFAPQEAYTGLFGSDLKPKPALSVIERWPGVLGRK